MYLDRAPPCLLVVRLSDGLMESDTAVLFERALSGYLASTSGWADVFDEARSSTT
jgi:hypothetical protein